jgi:hypothetical protein
MRDSVRIFRCPSSDIFFDTRIFHPHRQKPKLRPTCYECGVALKKTQHVYGGLDNETTLVQKSPNRLTNNEATVKSIDNNQATVASPAWSFIAYIGSLRGFRSSSFIHTSTRSDDSFVSEAIMSSAGDDDDGRNDLAARVVKLDQEKAAKRAAIEAAVTNANAIAIACNSLSYFKAMHELGPLYTKYLPEKEQEHNETMRNLMHDLLPSKLDRKKAAKRTGMEATNSNLLVMAANAMHVRSIDGLSPLYKKYRPENEQEHNETMRSLLTNLLPPTHDIESSLDSEPSEESVDSARIGTATNGPTRSSAATASATNASREKAAPAEDESDGSDSTYVVLSLK